MSLIPPPSYAATVWLTGESLCIGLPEAGTVVISLDNLEPHKNDFGQITPSNRGLAVLLDILRSRMQNRAPTIGQKAAPVRYDVEQALASDEKYNAWLDAMTGKKAERAKEAEDASKLLAEIGL